METRSLLTHAACALAGGFALYLVTRGQAPTRRLSSAAAKVATRTAHGKGSKSEGKKIGERQVTRDAAKTSIRLLCINDVYDLEGFSKIQAMLPEFRGPNSLFCINGDFLGGSTLSVQTQGRAVVDVLNKMDVDFAGIGNHEFDYGPAGLKKCMEASNFKWFGSNVVNTSDKKIFDGVTDLHVFHVPSSSDNGTGAGVTVGVFGLCTPATPKMSYPGETVTFLPLVETAQRCVDSLKAQGAQVIVALTHVTLAQDKLIASKVKDLDVLLGGHDHDPFAMFEGGSFLFKCGQDCEYLGIVDLVVTEQPDGSIEVDRSWSMVNTAGLPSCPEISAIIQGHMDEGISEEVKAEVLCRVEGGTLSSLTQEGRSVGNTFGLMVADALAHYYKADLGMINGGFIRDNKEYPEGSAVTVGHVLEELPFPREAVLLNIKGKDIRGALEEELRFLPALSGAFPHVSQGWSLEYSATAPAGQRVQSLKHNGADVDPERTYTLALTAFMAAGGDDCVSFLRSEKVSEHAQETTVSTVVINYLRCMRDGDASGNDSDGVGAYHVQKLRMHKH